MTTETKKRLLIIGLALLLVSSLPLGAFVTPAPQAAASAKPEAGIWGLYPNVIAEYIKIPGCQEPHTPEVFNHIYFMRYRYDTGEKTPPPLKAVIIGQPGLHSGHGLWYELASQIVDAGKGDIEVWVIDRRENGLEDTLGVKLALDAKRPQVGLNYYYGSPTPFVELKQEDVPFMAHWGLEVAIKDVEAILNLIPEERQATNVFLAGHSEGCSFMLNFAGYQFPDGKAGFEKAAGLIFIDGHLKIEDDNEETLAEWQAGVQSLIDGDDRRFGLEWGDLVIDQPKLIARGHMTGMMGFWDPNGESPYRVQSIHLSDSKARDFLQQLRLTNEAYCNFSFDDDPIPGSMTQMETFHTSGMRSGRLDFPSLSEAGVPADLPDPHRVYGWLSGGAGEVGGETDDGPLNCYPSNQMADWQFYPPNPNVTRARTACLYSFFAGEATNIEGPTTYRFPVSGQVDIYEGCSNNTLWYSNKRYSLDVWRATDMNAPEMNVTRKADIDIPTMAYQSLSFWSAVGAMYGVDLTLPPMEEFASMTRITDWTLIDTDGVQYSAQAEAITTFPTGTDTRLYNHMDFLTADNSLAGEVVPGQVGANVVTNTLASWILARAEGTAPAPEIAMPDEDAGHATNRAPLIGGIVGGILVIGLVFLLRSAVGKRAKQA